LVNPWSTFFSIAGFSPSYNYRCARLGNTFAMAFMPTGLLAVLIRSSSTQNQQSLSIC